MPKRLARTITARSYLLSFWKRGAHRLPCGLLLFFDPLPWAVPSLLPLSSSSFLNTGPLKRHRQRGQGPIRHAIHAINLFHIYCSRDTFSAAGSSATSLTGLHSLSGLSAQPRPLLGAFPRRNLRTRGARLPSAARKRAA